MSDIRKYYSNLVNTKYDGEAFLNDTNIEKNIDLFQQVRDKQKELKLLFDKLDSKLILASKNVVKVKYGNVVSIYLEEDSNDSSVKLDKQDEINDEKALIENENSEDFSALFRCDLNLKFLKEYEEINNNRDENSRLTDDQVIIDNKNPLTSKEAVDHLSLLSKDHNESTTSNDDKQNGKQTSVQAIDVGDLFDDFSDFSNLTETDANEPATQDESTGSKFTNSIKKDIINKDDLDKSSKDEENSADISIDSRDESVNSNNSDLKAKNNESTISCCTSQTGNIEKSTVINNKSSDDKSANLVKDKREKASCNKKDESISTISSKSANSKTITINQDASKKSGSSAANKNVKKSTTSNNQTTTNKKIDETSDDEGFCLNIKFNKNTTNTKIDETATTSFSILEDDYDQYLSSDNESFKSAKSIRSNKSAKTTKTRPSSKCKPRTTDFKVFFIKLPEYLIEMGIRNAEKAEIEIKKYERKIINDTKRTGEYSSFNFIHLSKPASLSTTFNFDEPTTSSNQFRFGSFDLNDEDNDIYKNVTSRKNKRKSSNNDNVSSSSDEEKDFNNKVNKKARKRHEIFSSSSEDDSDDSLSCDYLSDNDCEISDSLFISKDSKDNRSKNKIKLKVSECYTTSEDSDSNNSSKELACKIVNVNSSERAKSIDDKFGGPNLIENKQQRDSNQSGKKRKNKSDRRTNKIKKVSALY